MERDWNDDDDGVLFANWRAGATPTREQEAILDRTRYAITARANRLGLRREITWTAERIEKLRGLWARNLSASEIADAIGGISRNSVLGKVHRLGLPGRASPIRGVVGSGRQRGRRLARRKAGSATTLATYLQKHPPAADTSPLPERLARTVRAPERSTEAVPLPVSPVPSQCGEREGGGRPCQWIHDRDVPKWPGKPKFCGAPAVFGESWCPEHRARCFISKAERLVDKARLERLAAAE